MGGIRHLSLVHFRLLFNHFTSNSNQTRCVTKIPPLLSLTMAPACAKLDSPVMTPPGLSSLPLLDVPATRVSWLVWVKRMPMLGNFGCAVGRLRQTRGSAVAWRCTDVAGERTPSA